MALDVNMILETGQTVTTTANNNYIEVEGGLMCWCRMWTGAMTGASTTLDIYVQQSLDVGANYYMAPGGKFQELGPTNDNVYMAIPVFIGLPATSTNKTRVRIRYIAAGSSPSYAITLIALEPMVSITAPSIDQPLAQGVYALVAAL